MSDSASEKGGLELPWFLHGLVLVLRVTGGVFSLIMKEEGDIMKYVVLAYVAWVAVDLFVALLWYVGRRLAFLLSGLFQHESFETRAYRPLKHERPLSWFLQWVEDYVIEFFCFRGVCLLGFVYFAMDSVAEETYDYVYTAPLWADVLLAIVTFGFRYHQRNDDNVKRWARTRGEAAEASARGGPPSATQAMNRGNGAEDSFQGPDADFSRFDPMVDPMLASGQGRPLYRDQLSGQQGQPGQSLPLPLPLVPGQLPPMPGMAGI